MKNLSRRNFLKVSAVAGAGATFGFSLSGCSSTTDQLESSNKSSFTNAWINIPESGNISFTCPRAEMGQGISTGLAMLVCEGLDYP
ncbi:MAG: twin-arginine translocation signal domain-containing protein, partial [Draconibacterium sp.]|nr:twin-arginine translocation signal domain-containing protein [Draconibacterium sp.]